MIDVVPTIRQYRDQSIPTKERLAREFAAIRAGFSEWKQADEQRKQEVRCLRDEQVSETDARMRVDVHLGARIDTFEE